MHLTTSWFLKMLLSICPFIPGWAPKDIDYSVKAETSSDEDSESESSQSSSKSPRKKGRPKKEEETYNEETT